MMMSNPRGQHLKALLKTPISKLVLQGTKSRGCGREKPLTQWSIETPAEAFTNVCSVLLWLSRVLCSMQYCCSDT